MTVTNLSFIPKKDPMSAKTLNDYNLTGLYEIISSIGEKSCVPSDAISFYRYVDNVLKKSAKPYKTGPKCSMMNGCSESSGLIIERIDYCGLKMDIDSSYGISTGAISQHNISGRVGGGYISFY